MRGRMVGLTVEIGEKERGDVENLGAALKGEMEGRSDEGEG